MKRILFSPDSPSGGATAPAKSAKRKAGGSAKPATTAKESPGETALHELFVELGHDTRSNPRCLALVKRVIAGTSAKGGARE